MRGARGGGNGGAGGNGGRVGRGGGRVLRESREESLGMESLGNHKLWQLCKISGFAMLVGQCCRTLNRMFSYFMCREMKGHC